MINTFFTLHGKLHEVVEGDKYKEIRPAYAVSKIVGHTPTNLVLCESKLNRHAISLVSELFRRRHLHNVIVSASLHAPPSAESCCSRRYISKGSTKGLYSFLSTYTRYRTVDFRKTPALMDMWKTHPAWPAVQYLMSVGVKPAHIFDLLYRLGDVRYAHLKAAGMSRVVSETLNNHEVFPADFTNGYAYPLIGSCARFAINKVTADPVIMGLVGDRYTHDTFASDECSDYIMRLTDLNSKVDSHIGVSEGIYAVLVVRARLLMSEWLAADIHPELFDSKVFDIADSTDQSARWRANYDEVAHAT